MARLIQALPARARRDKVARDLRQHANLARAFAIEPEILLMDEPFAALDAQTRELMQGELLRIWQHIEAGARRSLISADS